MDISNTRDYLMSKHRIRKGDWKPPFLMYGKRSPYLPTLFRELNFTSGAEIGVEKGHFSEQLCKGIPGLKLFAIDAWESYGYFATKSSNYSQEGMEKRYQKAAEVLSEYNCEIIRAFSHVAVEKFADESLDFIHIDSNHDFEHTYQDIFLWEKKVRTGGIISVHDYLDTYNPARCRVKEAVDKWTAEHDTYPWFIIVGSQSPTCFWIK